jgi:hypothetical protein
MSLPELEALDDFGLTDEEVKAVIAEMKEEPLTPPQESYPWLEVVPETPPAQQPTTTKGLTLAEFEKWYEEVKAIVPNLHKPSDPVERAELREFITFMIDYNMVDDEEEDDDDLSHFFGGKRPSGNSFTSHVVKRFRSSSSQCDAWSLDEAVRLAESRERGQLREKLYDLEVRLRRLEGEVSGDEYQANARYSHICTRLANIDKQMAKKVNDTPCKPAPTLPTFVINDEF